ncbi:hypothetical protein [Streptomyces blattellae]|uniref:hypothetical protein n=1 Tax=Streptomyces blattellae TaxID=2569855 RepID=UPI0018ACBC2B|nr:hypothetical protein [Streptomyces blattellae]
MNPIVRRIGSTPAERGSTSSATCPDVLELRSGDFMVIGNVPGVPNITAAELREHGANVGPGEQAVIVPRKCMLDAARDLTGKSTSPVDDLRAAATLLADSPAAVQAMYEGLHGALCRAQDPECDQVAPLFRDAIRAGLLNAQTATLTADDQPREHP